MKHFRKIIIEEGNYKLFKLGKQPIKLSTLLDIYAKFLVDDLATETLRKKVEIH